MKGNNSDGQDCFMPFVPGVPVTGVNVGIKSAAVPG